jgi:hypothetical protein
MWRIVGMTVDPIWYALVPPLRNNSNCIRRTRGSGTADSHIRTRISAGKLKKPVSD